MGAEVSRPKSNTTLKVIGAGLPRTGTASLAAALSILYDGPVYHGGTQNLCSDDEQHIKAWIGILSHRPSWPFASASDKQYVLQRLRDEVNGYVATVDAPLAQFTPELMELYPDVKVVCTVRDPDAWAKSIDATASATKLTLLSVILFWVPTLRHLGNYSTVLQQGRWGELYSNPAASGGINKAGDPELHGRAVWDRHITWLKAVVPEEKLSFFDVRDGWEPLCQALGEPVPKAAEFPRINDGKAIENFAKKQMIRGIIRWAAVLCVCTFTAATVWYLW